MTIFRLGWCSSTPAKITDIKTSAMCIWKLEMLAARAASRVLPVSFEKSRRAPPIVWKCTGSPRAALDLADRGVGVVVGDAGEAGETLGMVAAEIGEPVVVDAQHRAGGLVVVEAAGGAEDAVQDLGLDAVAILLLEPQIGVGEAADALLAVLVKPGRGHPVGAMDRPRDV